jgi:hypothetical protein
LEGEGREEEGGGKGKEGFREGERKEEEEKEKKGSRKKGCKERVEGVRRRRFRQKGRVSRGERELERQGRVECRIGLRRLEGRGKEG